jgi:hypothetical protein
LTDAGKVGGKDGLFPGGTGGREGIRHGKPLTFVFGVISRFCPAKCTTYTPKVRAARKLTNIEIIPY